MSKILCPYHDDTTPSMEVYETHSHCMVCGAHVANEKVGMNVRKVETKSADIESELTRIRDLPIKRFRGLRLHCSDKAAYIIWPDVSFFKQRNFYGQIRYVGPKGIKPPLFIYPGNKNRLIVIEGELNCMSVYETVKDLSINYTLCSPGSAANFSKFINLYKEFKHVTLILDKDSSGVVYGTETKEKLLKSGKRTDLVLVDSDYNDILVSLGPKALVEEFRKGVEV